MIQPGSIMKVCDKTGVVLAQCIKVLGPYHKKIAYLGDSVIVSVKRINPKKFRKVKLYKRKRYLKGTLHRGLIVRAKYNYCRLRVLFVRFNENGVVITNKKKIPMSNRLYGPVLRELCLRVPTLGCISRMIL